MSSKLPHPTDIRAWRRGWATQRSANSRMLVIFVAGFATLTLLASSFLAGSTRSFGLGFLFTGLDYGRPINAREILHRCAAMRATPAVPRDFHARKESERYEYGNDAVLILDATIFTGKNNGQDIFRGDILLDRGVIKGIKEIPGKIINEAQNLTVIQANGAWVTPGLVDLHSHLGVVSAPVMDGTYDVNSRKGPILPWLRSIDALNTHDDGYELAIAGGVTTAQILPGSVNALGGQAFMVKLRKVADRSATSMVVEPPDGLNGAEPHQHPPKWRHMKQACGENVRVYGTRMDNVWALRSAYEHARQIKVKQDDYCSKAEAGLWYELKESFPEDLQWEILVDVLRGKVKITTHCYEAVDIDAIVRLTNEFKFPLASFHHASDAYLIPDVLKRTYGGVPAIAMWATYHRTKRESYRGSEFASRVLADQNVSVVMKTDHPVTGSRNLIHQAQQAYYFGLPEHLALASVTSTPAIAAGLDHRVGILAVGADADVVLWDSHPLQPGATPKRVWIDGLPQIPVPRNKDPVQVGVGKEGEQWRKAPEIPNWDEERRQTLLWDGLPPLQGTKQEGEVVFMNVKNFWKRVPGGGIENALDASEGDVTVIVEGGRIICSGTMCVPANSLTTVIDLKGGSIAPGLMSFGSLLGTEEISSESSTGYGEQIDAMMKNVPAISSDVGAIPKTMDALMFGTRNALTAYRSGVTTATSALAKPFFLDVYGDNMIAGVSATFSTGASHAKEEGAILQSETALHIIMGRPYPVPLLYPTKRSSVTSQISTLRSLLHDVGAYDKVTGEWFQKAAAGGIPLIIDVHSADIMALLLILKEDVESKFGRKMKMVFSGATEAHLLAKEIKDAGVGVILNPIRPFPIVWDQRRILPGPPLTNNTALMELLEHGVTVGVGALGAWGASNTRFELLWAVRESNARLTEIEAYTLASTKLEELLGVDWTDEDMADSVAYEGGGALDMSSKVSAVISPARGIVDFL